MSRESFFLTLRHLERTRLTGLLRENFHHYGFGMKVRLVLRKDHRRHVGRAVAEEK